jgi:hypothetical protein
MSVAQTLHEMFSRSMSINRANRANRLRNRKARDRFVPTLSVTTLENRLLLSASISGTADPDAIWMLDTSASEHQDVTIYDTVDASMAEQSEPQWTDPGTFVDDFNAWYQSQDFSMINEPISVRLTPAMGSHVGLSIEVPDGIVLIIDGSSGGVHFTGASPALTVTSGHMIVENASFATSTNDPTIVVQSGATLTLVNTVVNESDVFNQSAILVQAGGMLDLSSGDNLINVRGDGQLITWQSTSNIDILGNRLAVDGVEFNSSSLADNFAIENRITHALDQASLGQVRWVAQQSFVTQESGSIARAVASATTGDTIHVAAGTFLHTGQLDINDSIAIVGAGQGETIVMRSGQATGKELRTVQINAADVTIEGLTFNGWETLHTNATVGNGYLVWLNTGADSATFNDVRFHGEDIRVAIYLGTRNDFTITNSLFTGTYFRAAIRGAGERMLISHNRFEESHYWYSPIYMEYGGQTSGDISFNYFVSRVGVENTSQGLFKSDGTGLHAITNLQPNRTTADGLRIFHNTFHFQDADLVNELGNRPIAEAIHISPSLPASGPIEIRDNIFQGYTYTGPQFETDPMWRSGEGVFGGALELNGDGHFGIFQSPIFDIGEKGSMTVWINTDTLGKRQMLAGGAVEYQLRHTNDIYFYPGNLGSNNTLIWSSDTVSSNTWTHVAFTWDHATQSGNIYFNGNEVNYRNTYGANVSPSWTQILDTVDKLIFIGRDPGNPGSRDFDGKMDDLAWFNDVLTVSQIQNIRDQGVAVAAGTEASLVAHWDFDQTAGNIAIDNKNGIEMQIITNGIVPFGPEFRPGMGQFGGALEFDGRDDFATFQDPAFDVGEMGTINFWVRMDNTARRNQFLEGPGNSGFEVQYRTNSSGQVYSRVTTDGDFVIRSGGDRSGLTGNWTNIQVIYDFNGLPSADGGGSLRIYLNGVESGYLNRLTPTDLTWAGVISTVNEMMNLGRDPGDPSRFFDGLMDDFAWFNDVLTASERAAIRSMAVGDSALSGDPRLLAYWNFDDAVGTTLLQGDGGTQILLYLQAEPPLPPLQGFAINASANTLVSNNVFFENDVNFNAIVNDAGDNLFGDPVFNLLRPVPDPSQPDYQVGFGGMATYASSEFLVDSFTPIPHVGAYQGNPGLFGSGDLIVRGSAADDLLVISEIVRDPVTGLYSAEARYVRDVGGPNEVVLDPIMLVDVAGITFNGDLGDDHFIIIHPSGGVFAPPSGIAFNGGTGGEDSPGGNSPGDLLELRGGAADTVSYDIMNGLDGSISYDGTLVISYTGVEPMIDTVVSNDREFVWQNLAGTLRLIDEPTAALQRVEFDNGQQLQFQVPSDSLEIVHVGAADHDIEVLSLDKNFIGNLTIDNTSDVRIETAVDIQGGLFVDGDNVFFQQAITTGQAIQVSADNELFINGNVDAGNGTITLLVNQDATGDEGLTQAPLTTLGTGNTTANAVFIQVGGDGNFLLSQIETGTADPAAQVSLEVGGAIVNVLPTGVANIISSKLLIDAGSGIGGPVKPLHTDVNFLQASSAEGYIWIVENDDIQLQGVSATGAIATGPAQINIQSLAGAISVLNGTVIRSSTGQVNNIPPRLRLTEVDPTDVLLPGDPTQEVVGTIGGIESLGDQLELGSHFRIEAKWDDGIVSVLDFPTDPKVSTTVAGAPVEPILQAGDNVVWLIDETNVSTASIVRGPVAEGPIQILIQRTFSLLYLQMLRQPEVVATFDLFNDQNIVLSGATQPSLNRSESVVVVTPVAEELIRPSVPVVLVEPPVIIEESRDSVVAELPPPPPGQVIVYDEIGASQAGEEDIVTRLYLVRVLPNGEEGEQVNLSLSELRNLSDLLDRLKTAPIPNGLYRIYYQEAGLPSQQLLEFRKAGQMIGDPIREPGRGSNELESGETGPQAIDPAPEIDDSASLRSGVNQGQVESMVLSSRFSMKNPHDEATSFTRVARQIRRWSL